MQKLKQDLSHYGDFRKYSVTEIGRDYFTSKTAIQEFLTANIGKELSY